MRAVKQIFQSSPCFSHFQIHPKSTRIPARQKRVVPIRIENEALHKTNVKKTKEKNYLSCLRVKKGEPQKEQQPKKNPIWITKIVASNYAFEIV